MIRALGLGAVMCVTACAARKPPTNPLDVGGGVGERLDRAATQNELRVAILDGYRMVAQGYDNVYIDGVARDERLVLFDVGPDDLVIGDPTRGAAIRALFPGEDYEIVSKNLDVHLSADGSCAWSYDDLSTRVVRNGRRAIFPLRVTSLYERREGRWLKLLEHVSYASPLDEASARALVIDLPFPDAVPVGDAGARARDVVMALISSAPRAVPVADARLIAFDHRVLEGAAAADLPTVGSLFPLKTTVEQAGLRIATSTTGTVIWAAALLTIRTPTGTFTARATWVLETRDGELLPVQTHVSVPIPEAALADAVWGTTIAPTADPTP